MRCDQDARVLPQPFVGWTFELADIDVERDAAQLFCGQSTDQRGFVDNLATCHVDQTRPQLHRRKRLRPDQPIRLRRPLATNRDELGGTE